MGRRPSRVALVVAILAALPAAGADAAGPQAQELIVGFRAGVTQAQQERALEQAGARTKRRFGRIRAALVTGRAEVLRRDPRVRYVEPNRTIRADADPAYGQLWGLENTGQLVGFSFGVPDADTDAPDAWSATEGAGVVVAVTDTGVDMAHPDLASQIWSNADETPGNGVDDDGNGFVDDVRGWDFANGDADPRDDHGHGTHVAGTIAATRDNGVGIVGVAPSASVMAVKFLNAEGVGTLAGAVDAVLYAGANGASVINASWGDTEFSQALLDAIESVDALVVASAGNSASDNDAVPHYPSGFDAPNVVSVAATDNRDHLGWFSNVGAATVDLGAPGVAVYSTWPGGGYRFLDGTSMASPHVSGAAALALAARPGSTPAGLKALLLATADPSPWLAGATVTGARLNANAAVRCSGPTLVLASPAAALEGYVGEPIPIRAQASRCGLTGGVAVSAAANGAPVELSPAGDGVYTGSFTPTAAGSLTIEVTASADGQSVTRTAAGNVSPVLSVAVGDPPLTLTFAAGQNAKLLFAGTDGQRVSVVASSVSVSWATLTLRDPDGVQLGAALSFGRGGGFLEPRELPKAGTYSLLVDPSGAYSGSITLALHDVPPDPEASLAFGSAASLALSVPGQNGRATFAGAAGQRVSLKLSSSTINNGRVSILSPDGSTLAPSTYFGISGGFVEPRSLPLSGVYTVLVDPNAAATGSVTLTPYDVPPDATATLAFGTSTALATTVPGQNARATFTGAAGRTVSLKLSSVTMSGARVSILSPDGSTLAPSTYFSTTGGFVEPRSLPLSGVYTVVVDPNGAATGSVTLTPYDVPPDVQGTLAVATPLTLSVSVPGQNARASFAGSAGKRVSLNVSGVTTGLARISVLAPDGSTLVAPLLVASSGTFVEPLVLASSGTYVVVVDPQGAGTGSVTLALYEVPADAQAALALGGTATLTVSTPGQNAQATFDAAAGQARTLRLTGVTISLTVVRITGPDGATVVAATYVGTSGKTFTFTPSRAGVHTVYLDPQRAYTGSATLTLS